ncbi:hypothetical protein VPUCM_p0037 (plasmid) [Vibrio parahaemolyticus UCM-V493]|nr:hypothetical protein VPUCM_p0037 [Vibrio parahaemolyticus UCM-V493]
MGCVGEYLGQYRFVLDGARFRSEDPKGIRLIMMQVFDVLSGLAPWLVSLMVISVSANFLYAAKALVSMGKARVDPTIRCEFMAFFIPLGDRVSQCRFMRLVSLPRASHVGAAIKPFREFWAVCF